MTSAAAPGVDSTRGMPLTAQITDTAVARLSEVLPFGATIVTLLRLVNAAPVRGSMM